jgi:hypothetical protein
MSARSFRSVFMVATCAGAALTCYLVSLNVASERASLEEVETKIVLAQRDIRSLQTEIGTRGRMAQLERWNAKVLALSAPSADQFLEGGFQLARLGRPEPTQAVEAPVVLASAPAPHPQSAPLEEGEPVADGAGVSLPAARLTAPVRVAAPAKAAEKKIVKAAETKPGLKDKKAGDKTFEALAKPVTKPIRVAKVDPLAPLPTAAKSKKTTKDSGTAR